MKKVILAVAIAIVFASCQKEKIEQPVKYEPVLIQLDNSRTILVK